MYELDAHALYNNMMFNCSHRNLFTFLSLVNFIFVACVIDKAEQNPRLRDCTDFSHIVFQAHVAPQCDKISYDLMRCRSILVCNRLFCLCIDVMETFCFSRSISCHGNSLIKIISLILFARF